jgi:hypothetical protein
VHQCYDKNDPKRHVVPLSLTVVPNEAVYVEVEHYAGAIFHVTYLTLRTDGVDTNSPAWRIIRPLN